MTIRHRGLFDSFRFELKFCSRMFCLQIPNLLISFTWDTLLLTNQSCISVRRRIRSHSAHKNHSQISSRQANKRFKSCYIQLDIERHYFMGVIKRGWGMCGTFKAFNLTCLHVLCSYIFFAIRLQSKDLKNLIPSKRAT